MKSRKYYRQTQVTATLALCMVQLNSYACAVYTPPSKGLYLPIAFLAAAVAIYFISFRFCFSKSGPLWRLTPIIGLLAFVPLIYDIHRHMEGSDFFGMCSANFFSTTAWSLVITIFIAVLVFGVNKLQAKYKR